MLLVMYLRLGLRLPLDKIRNFFQDMYQLKISDGEIVFILKKLVIVFGRCVKVSCMNQPPMSH